LTGRPPEQLDRRQFLKLVEYSSEFIGIYALDGQPVWLNLAARRALDGPLPELVAPADAPRLEEMLTAARRGETPEQDLRLCGGRRVSCSLFPIGDATEAITTLAMVGRDVTKEHRVRESLARENALLEMIGRNAPVGEVLERLALGVEQASENEMLVSVLVLDDSGRRLLTGAAPSLPEAYTRAIHGLEIGPSVGSCGTAAYTGQPVVVEDISTDPLWAPYRALAAEHGLAACTSLPIRAQGGGVTGTLAMYYRVPRPPDDADRALLATAVHLAGIAIDRERHSRAMRRNEDEFRTLANTIPQLAWMAHADGSIFWYNERWYEYTGTTAEQMEGWGWAEVHDPEVLPHVVARWKHSLATGESFEMEFPLRSAEGVFRTFLTRVAPIRDEDGNVIRWFGTNTDIDEQRRGLERTRTLVEASSQAIWSADAEGRMRVVSPSWAKLTGQSDEEMSDLGWLEALYSGDRPRVRAAWEDCIRTGEIFSEQFRVWSVDNRYRWVRAKGVPILNRAGQAVEWVVANADVTEQVEAEQQLQRRARYAAFRSTIKAILQSADTAAGSLQRCCEALVSQLALEGGLIWTLEGQEFELQARQGLVPPGQLSARIPAEDGLIGLVARSERGYLNNALGRTADEAWREWVTHEGLEALVGHAILDDGRVVAVLIGLARTILPVDITEELGEVAGILGFWWRNRRIDDEHQAALQREQAARREAESLLSLAEEMATTTSRDTLVQAVTDTATRLTGAAFGAFFYNVVDTNGERYMLYSISGVPAEHFKQFTLPRNTGVFSPTFRGEGPVRSDDILADPRYGHNQPYQGLPKGHLPVRSYLAVPVKRSNGEVLGGLFFGHPECGRFTEHHVRLAQTISLHAAQAFDRGSL